MRTQFLASFFSIFLLTMGNADAQTLNQEMQRASQSLTALMPYIYNDQAFRAPESKTTIDQNIDNIIQIIERTPKLLGDHAVTLEISQQSLLESLQQARSLYNTGAYSTAQYLLAGVPIICSSCHIQDGQQASMTQKMDRALFADDFSFAEFNYYLRNYTQAQASYRDHLKIWSTQTSRIQAEKTLQRLLDIALITSDNTTSTVSMLQKMQTLPKLDMETKQTIELWLKGLKSMDYTPVSLDQLEQSIYETFDEHFTLEHEFIFNEENRPKALLWRLQLHQQLRKGPERPDTARALYLLSILERTLGDQIDISLANLYLKECIRLNVRDYSSKCLNEYENHLYFYYGGSSGEHLPGEILKELKIIKNQYRKES